MSSSSKTNDEESPSKGNDDNYEADSSLDDPLCDGIEHDAELTAKEWIATNHEDNFNPGQTDCCRGNNIENGKVLLKDHCCQCKKQNENLKPAFQLSKMSSSKCYKFKYLLEEDNKDGNEQRNLN